MDRYGDLHVAEEGSQSIRVIRIVTLGGEMDPHSARLDDGVIRGTRPVGGATGNFVRTSVLRTAVQRHEADRRPQCADLLDAGQGQELCQIHVFRLPCRLHVRNPPDSARTIRHHAPKDEATALLLTLETTDPTASTACVDWSAHELVAHLAAGAAEMAAHAEHALCGAPEQAAMGLAEREAPFVAMEDQELRARLIEEALG